MPVLRSKRLFWGLTVCVVNLAVAVQDPLRAFDENRQTNTDPPAQEIESSQEKTQSAESVKPAESVNAQDKAPKDKPEAEPEFVELLTEDLSVNWKQFSLVPAPAESPVWKITRGEDGKELVLVCSGEPKGYLHTTQIYTDFELKLEWKYPTDADGNSGVLVYTRLEPRIWPSSIQVQLHQPKAGSVFPSGDATSDNSSEAEPGLARPVDTWNECRVVSQGGRLTVEVNGTKAGQVSGAKPSTGTLALQSEGSIVHFRRIRIRNLTPSESSKSSELPPTPPQSPATVPPDSAPGS